MEAIKRRLAVCLVLPSICLVTGLLRGQQVALTFDDLPAHGPLPQGMSREDVASRIIGILKTAQSPPIYGFVNAKRIDEDPSTAQVLKLWRAAGFPLGSHSFSHMDLDTNSVGAFEQDVLANEPTLKKYMDSADWHWFRYPFLHEGDTLEKRKAVTEFLTAHGYRIAEVTLNFDDYAYNEPYARCMQQANQDSLSWLQNSYLSRASELIQREQDMSRLIYGREIKYVMLLHIGAFETVMLPKLLDYLKQHGFKLITLEDAESDPAYSQAPAVALKGGGTMLDQMMVARHLSQAHAPDNTFAELDKLCR